MTPIDRALKALRTVFRDGRVDCMEVEVTKPFESGWQNESTPKTCYLFLVLDGDGVTHTAGCFYTDEFMELFTDDELVVAFRERFVPKARTLRQNTQ